MKCENKPEALLWKFVVLVFHMLNLFDYFDYRLGMVRALAVVFDQFDRRSELLSIDYYHPQMDCILLGCLIVAHFVLPAEQLDPKPNENRQ